VDSTIALVNWGCARLLVCLLPAFSCVLAQSESPSPSAAGAPFEETIVPTFETQKLARTYVLDVPAPRGLITDRNGIPFAQNRLMFNLAISFPTPLDFSDPQLLTYTHEKIQAAEKLLGRSLKISDDLIKRHYHNRGILPLEITQNLNEKEADDLRPRLAAEMTLRPYYVRIYPQGRAAGQVIGYSGKTSRTPDGIIDNHEVLWPETEGREGLEQTFNQVLTGKHGEYKITFDKDGRKTS
jgi:penicillin-binding protein 2